MGKIKSGILGGFSGKVGNIVGSSWKGIDVIKSQPLSVANPKTASQQAQRGAFGETVAFAVVILSTIIKPLWDRFASRMSGFNAFIKANIDNFNSAGIVDYSLLKISQGKIAAPDLLDVSADIGELSASVTWNTDILSPYELASDIPYIVLINESNGWIVKIQPTDKTRGDGVASIDLPASVPDPSIWHCYLAFKRADGTLVSDTAYVTNTAT